MPGIAYGSPQQQPYGLPPNMYAQQPYGRGYAQAAPAGYAAPPQQGWANPYTYADPSQQAQPHQPPSQGGGGQGGY